MEKLNIYHGNAIMVPEDIGKWEIEPKQEGGLLDEEIRNKSYDVVVGNPPYTHLRNLENRRYHTYPKQRDMAQVFVRWALDHITEKGVISFNTTDAWLNVKTSDGAKETRHLVDERICAIEQLELYSEGSGGNITTFIICLGRLTNRIYKLNGKNKQYIIADLQRHNFIPIEVSEYYGCRLGNVSTPTSLNRGKSIAAINKWIRGNVLIHPEKYQTEISQIYILAPRHLGSRIPGAKFKLCMSNPTELKLTGEWKYISFTNIQIALWVFGCLNTKIAQIVLQRSVRQVSTNGNDRSKGDWIINLDNQKFAEYLVPDFDYYKTNHPEQFNSYMKWIEDNMRDKDKFLKGIDEQFEKLIK